MSVSKSNWVFVSAGEVSGDIHCANLISEINKNTEVLSFAGIGGDNLKNTGAELFYHIRDISFIGFVEIIRHVPFFKRILKNIENIVKENRPKAAILVDYPGFNLKLAKILKKYNIPVFYYISPQVWAWGKRRLKQIRKNVDLMAVFFEFEVEFYKKYGINVEFIGHPLVEKVKADYPKEEFFKKYNGDLNSKTIGILPGSRTQEVIKLLPPLLDGFKILKNKFGELQAFISVSPTVKKEVYVNLMKGSEDITLVTESPYNIMIHSDLLFVASGTATVESALAGTPMIVVYKIAPVTYLLSRILVKVKNFAMVNIIAGKTIVPELLQGEVTGRKVSEHAEKFLTDEVYYRRVENELNSVRGKLGEPGASEKGAKVFLENFMRL